jgi:hypothetical protein
VSAHAHSANGSRQRVVFVLGAGRSGTSAITRALPALGVALGDKLRPGRGKNPTGFFEDIDLLDLSKRVRRSLAIRPESVRLIADEEWQSPAIAALRDEAIEIIRRRFGQYAVWGFKYGRTFRILPFWEDVFARLGLDAAYVVAIRNPLSVARSRAQLAPERGTQEKSDLEWLVNVVPYFRLAARRVLVAVDYDRIVAAPEAELDRMVTALALPKTPATRAGMETYARDFLQAGRRHTVFSIAQLDADERIHPLLRAAYRWLDRLARDEVRPDSEELDAAWTGIENDLRALAPLLTHIDAVQEQLRRARRSPLGPLQAVPHLWRYLRNR